MGYFSDWMINSGRFSKVFTRKFFNSIAMYGAAAGLLWLSFIRCDEVQAMIAFSICLGTKAGIYAGFLVRVPIIGTEIELLIGSKALL